MTSLRQIASAHGVHASTVLRHLRAGRDLSTLGQGRPKKEPPPKQPRKVMQPRTYTSETVEQVREMAAQGAHPTEIARELGIPRHQVYNMSKRHSIALPTRTFDYNTIRDQVQDMKPRQAVEHLLYIVEELLGGPQDFVEASEVDGIPRCVVKLYLALYRASPCVLTKEQLLLIVTANPLEPAQLDLVGVKICNLRKYLPPYLVIHNDWGKGYWMEIKDGPE